MQPRRAPRSFAGPFILIVIGVIFMLRNFGMVSTAAMWQWFARYWPLLIIVWGLIKLMEYYQAQRAGYQPRGIGGGGVVLLVFLILFGLAASESHKVNWEQLGNEIDVDEDVFTIFGQRHSFNAELEQPLPGNVSLVHVISDRGDVTVGAWDQDKVKVSVRKTVGATNDTEAKRLDEQTQPQINVSGDTLTINANTGGAGDKPVKTDLEIWVPKKAALDVATKHGDVAVRQRLGDVKITTTRGDITVDEVAGNVAVTLRRGNITANRITGDFAVDGRVNATAVSEIGGSVRLNGDFFEGVNLSKIGKSVSFKSSRTDLEFAKLEGNMTMESDNLRAKGPSGPVRVLTRSKDIRLEDVAGDVRIENSNGEVEIHASRAPIGNIQVDNRHGRVLVSVPSKASFQLDARTEHGDIESDFEGIKVEDKDREARGTGTVGSGGPTIRITTDHADIEIRKSS